MSAHFSRTWQGTVGFINKETLDGRMVDAIYFLLVDGVRPVIDAETQEIVGTVDAVGVSDTNAIVGTGHTLLEPGTYSVGMDMTHVNCSMEEGELMHLDGRFIALVVNRLPAWQDCWITVKDDEEGVQS